MAKNTELGDILKKQIMVSIMLHIGYTRDNFKMVIIMDMEDKFSGNSNNIKLKYNKDIGIKVSLKVDLTLTNIFTLTTSSL